MPYLTGDVIAPTEFICRRVRIPNDINLIMAVNGAILTLTKTYNWELFGVETPEQASTLMSEMFYDYLSSNVCMIGAIFPYVTVNPPDYCLPCDGSTFNRVDYPQLYESLDSAFILDSDTFKTPDLRGRAVIGAGTGSGLTPRSVGDILGEENHQLIVAELPAHSHTNTPHAHSEIIAVSTLINGGVEAPASAAFPSASTTGLSSVSIDNTGGDDPHNNMQPSLALKYCVVAQ